MIVKRHQDDYNCPKYYANITFDEFALVLGDEQYRDMHYLLQHFQRLSRAQKYWRFHPVKGINVKLDPRAYWQFAIRSVLSEISEKNYKWTWSYFAERRNSRQMYVKLWSSYLASGKLADDEKSLMDKLEERLSYDDIRFFRYLARKEVQNNSALSVSKTAAKKGCIQKTM